MNRTNSLGLFFIVLAWIVLDPSYGYAGDTTLGTMITNVYTDVKGMPKIIAAFAYVSGLWLLVTSLYKFRDHVQKPESAPISAAVKRMIASGCLLSLPYMATVVVGNLFGDSTLGSNKLSMTMGANGTVAGQVDGMIYGFVTDIYGPLTKLICAFAYLAAMIFLILGISRLLHGMDKGPKGPAGVGTIMTFVVSGALFALGDMSGSLTSSLFGNTAVSNYPIISDSVLTGDDAKRVQSVISALLLFVNLVGIIAFLRGWFVLRQVADGGGGNTSYMQAFTFLIGGVIAMNIGEFISVLEKSMGITNALVTFST